RTAPVCRNAGAPSDEAKRQGRVRPSAPTKGGCQQDGTVLVGAVRRRCRRCFTSPRTRPHTENGNQPETSPVSPLSPVASIGEGEVPSEPLAALLTRLRDLGRHEDANWWLNHLDKHPEDATDAEPRLRKLIAKHEPKG